MQWICCNFNELTNYQIWEMYHIRAITFCVQQERTFVDADEIDLTAHHILGIDDNGQMVAYARFYKEADHWSFGRVLTVPEVRGQGMGKQLMDYLMAQLATKNVDKQPIVITAQADKEGFYEKFGFVADGDVFIHEQTPHIMMTHK
ncbi:GNAT family N-acetyltransferase [Lactobacillaceae bacterium Scapto_B20]